MTLQSRVAESKKIYKKKNHVQQRFWSLLLKVYNHHWKIM
jgi:hypothetical protein